MSRILRHVGNKDFKRTRQRQVDEQREIAAKKSKELQEAEEERRQIEEISRPYKSNWRDESQFDPTEIEPTQIEEDYVQFLLESDWTPVAGSIANSTTTTFISTIDNSTLLHVSGLGGVETTPKTAIIDFGFGDTLEVAAPDFSQLGLQGYVVGAMMKRRENEDVNAKLDASQEYARLVNADVLMDARVDLNPEEKKLLSYTETFTEKFNKALSEVSELPDKGFAVATEVEIRNKKTGKVQTHEVPMKMGQLTLSSVNQLNRYLKQVRANSDLEMATRKKYSDAAKKIASRMTKSYEEETPFDKSPSISMGLNKIHEYGKTPGTKLYDLEKKTKEILGGFTPGNPGGNKFNSNFEQIAGVSDGDSQFSVINDKTFESWNQSTKSYVNSNKFEYVDAGTITQNELLFRQQYNTIYLEGVLDGSTLGDSLPPGERYYTPYNPDALMDTGDEISVTKPNLLERLKSLDPKLKKESRLAGSTVNLALQKQIEQILGPTAENVPPAPAKTSTERKEVTEILTKPKYSEYLKQNPVVATELVYKMVPGVGNPGTQSLPGGGFIDPTLPDAPRKASIASVLTSTPDQLGNKKPSQVFKELGQIKETTPLRRVDPRMNSINSKVIEAISKTQTRTPDTFFDFNYDSSKTPFGADYGEIASTEPEGLIAQLADPQSTAAATDSYAKDIIKASESLRLEVYLDTKGLPTVGYGHLIDAGSPFKDLKVGDKITKAQADKLFDEDYEYHKKFAEKIPGYDKASPEQKAALIDLTFNMGPAWADGFPAFRKAFAAGDYETAGNELINSQWYGQVGRRANPIVSLIKGKGTGGASYLKNIPSIRSRLSPPPLPPLSNVGGMISPNTLAGAGAAAGRNLSNVMGGSPTQTTTPEYSPQDRARNQAARLGTKVAQGVADNLAAKSFGDFAYKGLKPGVKFDPNFAGGGPKGGAKLTRKKIPGTNITPLQSLDRAGQYTTPDPRYVKKYAKGGTVVALPKDQLRPTRGFKNPLGSQVSRGFDSAVGGGLERFSTVDDIARAAADPRARVFDLSTPAGAQQYDDFAKAAMAKSGLAGKLSRGASRAIPFVGAGLAFADAANRVKNGDNLGAALAVVSAVPGPIGWAGFGGQLAWDATNAILEAQAQAQSNIEFKGSLASPSPSPSPTSGRGAGRAAFSDPDAIGYVGDAPIYDPFFQRIAPNEPVPDKRSQAAAARRENQAAAQQRQQSRVNAQMDKFDSQMKDIEKRRQDLRTERDNWTADWEKSIQDLADKHQGEMDAHSALEKANDDAIDALTAAFEDAKAALGPGPGPNGEHTWLRSETPAEYQERMRTGQYVYHPIHSPNGKWVHGCGGICTRQESSPQWKALYDKYNADMEGLLDKANELTQAGDALKDDHQGEWDDHDKGDRNDEFGEREDDLNDEFDDLNNKMGDLMSNPGSVGKYDGGGSSSSSGRRGGQGGLPLGTTTYRSGGARGSRSQASSLASQASSAVGTNPNRRKNRRGSGVGTRTESTTWSRLKKYR